MLVAKKADLRFEMFIRQEIRESIAVKIVLLRRKDKAIAQFAKLISQAFRNGKKLLIFGNGGSAADAQHIAAEMVGRFQTERKPLPAVALTTDTSALTAIGNDYGFDKIFARQICALGNTGDVALAISTSGNSPNILKGLKAAKRAGMLTIGLTGRTGGKMKGLVDYCLCIPSEKTARIQESHILVGHILSGIVEKGYIGSRDR
jgi:D-sedoheptulose 7-phosphate isomerase